MPQHPGLSVNSCHTLKGHVHVCSSSNRLAAVEIELSKCRHWMKTSEGCTGTLHKLAAKEHEIT